MPAAPPDTFLGRLDPEARELLLSVAREVSYLKGTQLVRHGEPARGAWLLREGAADAVVLLPGGEQLTVAQLAAGSVFGEMALLDHGTCTATVRATLNVDGWFVEREDFRALVAQRNPVALRIQHAVTLILADKVRRLNARVLAWDSSEDRPARPDTAMADPLTAVARARQAGFDWRSFLPRLPLFEGFDENEIDEVAAAGRLLALARGAAVFLPGRPAEAAFLVVRGAVEVVARRDAMERRVAVLGPGQLFGFMSLLEGRPHGAGAYAREPALLLELSRPHFEALYAGSGSSSAKLRRALHRNLLVSIALTNRRLTRLISQARMACAAASQADLTAAYHGQIVA